MTVSLYCNVSGTVVSYGWEMKSINGGSWSSISNSNNRKYDVKNIQQSKQYRCVAAYVADNDAGSVASNAATIQVLNITSHPHNRHTSIGSNVTLTCTSSISSHVTFSWTHNGTNVRRAHLLIDGATSTLTISNVRYSNGGSYVCIVKSGSLSVTSNTATITVYGPLVFLFHPNSHVVTVGMTVSLYCNVSGTVVSYGWEMRSTNGGSWLSINNSDDKKYDVKNIQQSKQYRCIAGNSVGTVASNAATIQVLRITSHPQNRQTSIGSSVTLTCTSSISSRVTFSWTHNGTKVRKRNLSISGATSTLTISNVRYSNDGSYACIVKRGSLSVTSNTATITVYGPPVFLTHPNNHVVTVGMTVSLYCNVSGTVASYVWEMRSTNGGRWSRISNSNNYKYNVRNIQQSKQYRCVAGNDAGSVTSKAATIQILKITSHPHNRQIPIGSTVRLICTSSISSHVTFSWTYNGTNVRRVHSSITNGTTNTLTISNVRYSDSGSYVCIVSTRSLSVTSNTATITVYGPPVLLIHPNSHVVTVGMTVSLYCNVSGIVVAYVWEMRSTNGGSWSRISNSNSYKYDVRNIQQSKQYRCVAGNDAGSVTSKTATIKILKITSHPRNTKQLLIGSTVTLTCTSSISSHVTFSWTHNGTNVRRTHLSISGVTSSLTISNVRYSDSGSYVCVVKRGSLSVTSNTATITVYVPKPVIGNHPDNYKVKALLSVTFTCSASHVHGVTHSYSWHHNNGDIPSTRSTGQNTSTLTITRVIPPDEGMYYCIATNDGGSTSSRSASLTVDDELSITVSPLIQTVSEGGVATFTATATGIKTREFEYEWFKIERPKSITVGRTRSLIIIDVKVENEGSYYSCVKNQWNNMKCSQRVNLTISATSSVFTTHPQDQFIYNKEVAVFECAANGSDTLMITWTKDNEPIQNLPLNNITHSGKKSVLRIKKATVDSSGVYWCIATNADHDVVISNPAELLILPSVNTHPDNVTVLTGQSVDLTCSATGTDVVYQWMRNGVIISDDNSNVLRINEIKHSVDGTYQCIASNKGGNATSNPAMVTVYDKPRVIPFLPQTLGVLREQLQITCNATNDKDAPHNMMFTWMTPDGVSYNVKMTNEDDDHTASSTLYIIRLARSDNGTYKCYITNNNDSSGSVVTSTTVIIEERPSQPLYFNVTSEDDKSLKLIWSEPTNTDGKTDYYIIYYSDGKTSKTVNVFNFTGSYILEDLTPSTQYNISVRAVRLIGENDEILEGYISNTVSSFTKTASIDQESSDSNGAGSVIAIAVLAVLFTVALICCLGLIVIVFKLHRKIIFLEEKIKSADGKVKVPNPTYADLVVKSDEINMDSNPAYQCSSKQDDVKDHVYEAINVDDKVVKPVPNKSNTVSD